jgi:hypothetical protein
MGGTHERAARKASKQQKDAPEALQAQSAHSRSRLFAAGGDTLNGAGISVDAWILVGVIFSPEGYKSGACLMLPQSRKSLFNTLPTRVVPDKRISAK